MSVEDRYRSNCEHIVETGGCRGLDCIDCPSVLRSCDYCLDDSANIAKKWLADNPKSPEQMLAESEACAARAKDELIEFHQKSIEQLSKDCGDLRDSLEGFKIRVEGLESERDCALLKCGAVEGNYKLLEIERDKFKADYDRLFKYLQDSGCAPTKKKYRTPTDEDAKSRPECEFRQGVNHPWCTGRLSLVTDTDSDPLFFDVTGYAWYECRMLVEGE